MVDARQSTKRRARQANRVADRLAQLRERNNAQLAEARERERRVDEALREFATAGARIEAAEQSHANRVQRLQARIVALVQQQKDAIADDETARARAVLAIHECGRTVGELADLLALSERAVTRMLRDARTGATDTTGRRAPAPKEPASPFAAGSPPQRDSSDGAPPAPAQEIRPPTTHGAEAATTAGDRTPVPGQR